VQPSALPLEVKKHPDFNKNVKGFFGMQQNDDTKSNLERNMNNFLGVSASPAQRANQTLGGRFDTI